MGWCVSLRIKLPSNVMHEIICNIYPFSTTDQLSKNNLWFITVDLLFLCCCCFKCKVEEEEEEEGIHIV